jgi:hypothetical protein
MIYLAVVIKDKTWKAVKDGKYAGIITLTNGKYCAAFAGMVMMPTDTLEESVRLLDD